MALSLVSRNVFANFGGRLCTGLLSLALVPVYVGLIGVEAYGLVGLLTTFQAVVLVLDMGLSVTLNREMARLSTGGGNASEARDLVRTLETICWATTGGILLAAWPLTPVIAAHWVRPDQLPASSVREAMILMGLSVGLQFPCALYSGGLMGLQRQVLLNGIAVAMAVFRGVGALLVMWFVAPTIEAFLQWQVVSSAVQTAVTWRCLWGAMPPGADRPRFRGDLFRERWRFAGGVGATTLAAVILTQADKILLSRLLTLEQFGYYALAAVVAGGLTVVIQPVFAAVFPRLSQLAATGDEEGIKHLYHKSCQVMSVLVLPPAAVLALFSRDIMLLWTQSPATAEQTHRVVSLLAAGTALHGLMNVPYALQLASGWTRLALGVNIVSILLLVPLLVVLASKWGAPGGAAVWLALNAGHVLFTIPVMHRRLLRGEKWRWYGTDSGAPLLAALAVAVAVRFAVPDPSTHWGRAAAIVTAGALSFAVAAAAAPHVRGMVAARLKRGG